MQCVVHDHDCRPGVCAVLSALATLACDDVAMDRQIVPSYGASVVAHEVGLGAGFGSDALPGIVLGPPRGGGAQAGGLDVLSLGVGGWIVIELNPPAVDGDGPDLVVFENAFWPGGDATRVFAELAEVSVSNDGETWATFPCSLTPSTPGQWPGCAGWRPVYASPESAEVPVTLGELGGDPFDLAELGVASARFVRILDLSTDGVPPTAGFDLDAVAALHTAPQQ